MLFKLSLKNISKSIKDYAIYFFTLVLGVAIFYVFNAIESQTVMMKVSDNTAEIIRLMTNVLSGVSVFVSFVLGFLISNLTMLYINVKSFQQKAFRVSKAKMKILAKKYINFPKYNMPHSLLNTVSENAPIFLIPIFYGNTTLGLYAFGIKIVQAPLGLLSNAIFNVLGQKMAEEYGKGNEIYSIFKVMLKNLLKISLLMIPFFLFADDIFSFIFGIEWIEAGFYIQIMSIILIGTFILSPFSMIPHIFGQQKKAFIIEIVATFAKILPFIIGGYFFNLNIKEVLYIYVLLYSLVLLYGLIWIYSIVKVDSLEKKYE
jgi:O-antigen/teichoic acid export membrane protein